MKKIISWVALVLVFVCFISFSTLDIKDLDVISVQAKESDELKAPKYIFMFIGDGMSQVQVNAAQIYKGTTMSNGTELSLLSFTKFPVTGLLTTQNAETFVPDSASTATALSSGIKTNSGVLGLTADKTKVTETIAEKMKAAGKKVGIVTSVTLNHATPAAYYAHVPHRGEYYEIAKQLANSNFDYFGGGGLLQPTGKNQTEKDAFKMIEEAGYEILDTKEEILALTNDAGKVYALSPVLQDNRALPYQIDQQEGDLDLADFVRKGIDVLSGNEGFFMMVESGKIDWSCHANDAMTTINEVLGFEEAINVAIDFATKHPEETLILVTGDHETGGMSIGYAATGYETTFKLLEKQKMSYIAFDELIKTKKSENPQLTFEEVLPLIEENFGLVVTKDNDRKSLKNNPLILTDFELAKLKASFKESMKPAKHRSEDEKSQLLYGGYEPLSVTLTHILNNKAGIGWTTYAHTGAPVAIYAMGAEAELFGGFYDNTEVYDKLLEVTNLNGCED